MKTYLIQHGQVNEKYCTKALFLLVKIVLCSKLHDLNRNAYHVLEDLAAVDFLSDAPSASRDSTFLLEVLYDSI